MREINETWTLGGLAITVQNDSLDYPIVRMGRLEPLEHNYSIGHYGGTESMARDIRFTIFSGYDDNLIPLVGSGYHALVSDQEAEGNYFITAVRGERIQALNVLSTVFKVSADLRKEPFIPPPTWPSNIYFCAVGNGAGANKGGVWRTSTFTAHDEAAQPDWDKLSVTGSWPASNFILSFGIDISDPAEYVYALTRSTASDQGIDIIRHIDTNGTWDTILTTATVQATYGANANIYDMMIDPITGYLSALIVIIDNPNSKNIWYRCTNPSAGVPSWTSVASSVYYARGGVSNFWVYDDQATYVFTGDVTGFDHYIDVSTGGGAWNRTDMSGSAVANVRINHWRNRDTVDIYSTWSTSLKMNHWQIGDAANSGPSYVCSVASPQSVWERGQLELPRRNPQWFMPDPTDSSTLRFVGNYGAFAGRLLTTADKFQTYTNQGRLDIGLRFGPANRAVSMIADTVNEADYDMILYGSNDAEGGNEHTIYAAYESTDITPVGKSGANPDTGVDSIHYLAGGPCWRGIQVVTGAT